MKRVCIGISVHTEPARLLATVRSIRTHTQLDVECVLLPDGADQATKELISIHGELKQLGAYDAIGVAACFNRLLSAAAADVYVLLESGASVGPGWLDHLLAALNADPRHGLAGPSTNRSWNEQGIFPRSGGTPAEVAATAAEAVRRFGSEYRSLAPLHSLGDFCYAVRREVVDAVGAADERYGLGPCWEMDYSIRAARAGFQGVWACAAYVYRAPVSSWRQREEQLRFEASKHLYQHKFCAGHLRGEKTDYRPHCRGDECSNFAPASLIEIHRPFSEPPARQTPASPGGPFVRPTVSDVRESGTPLVSCIMPTYNRRRFVGHAADYFLRQDYPHLELVVIDDGDDPIKDCLPADERIRYFRFRNRLSVGAKRNEACRQARGSIIVHWDDDDWYPSWRVSAQVRALHAHGADVCGTSRLYYYDPGNDRAWQYEYKNVGGPAWVAGNTLAYRKACWERNHFLDIHVGEDSRFLWSNVAKAVHDCRDVQLCVGMIHDRNVSRKTTSGSYWQRRDRYDIHRLLSDDLRRYREGGESSDTRAPLVSCIMPTYNRRPYVQLALGHFVAQNYPRKELIVVDDGTDSVEDLVSGITGVRYIRLPKRTAIGAKRNAACEAAMGEVIAHWDDDDWYAPNRLCYQVAPIVADKAEITGLTNSYVLQVPESVFWTTGEELHRRMFVGDVHGGTLVYRKSLFEEGVRYPVANLAEDAALIRQALQRKKRLVKLANPGIFVYVRHHRNAWRFEPGRFLDTTGWTRTQAPGLFSAGTIEAYEKAARLSGAG